jgi:hypothetical protein
VLPLKHCTGDNCTADADNAAVGSVIVTLADAEQPLASVRPIVLLPAFRPVIDALVITPIDTAAPPLTVYEYPAVPPVTLKPATPLLPPWHETALLCDAETVKFAGSDNVILLVVEQPLVSYTVYVYAPADNDPIVAEVPFTDVRVVPPSLEYWYDAVPPEIVRVTEPSLLPWHLIADDSAVDADRALDGCVMVTVAVVLQFLESVTVNVLLPDEKLPTKYAPADDALPPEPPPPATV